MHSSAVQVGLSREVKLVFGLWSSELVKTFLPVGMNTHYEVGKQDLKDGNYVLENLPRNL